MTSDKNLFKCLFLIQVFASFLVFTGHYAASATTHVTTTLLETAIRHFSAFGTVLLAMLTGFFTAHSFEGKKTPAAKFFKGKFFVIYIPFLVFGLIYHYTLLGGIPHLKHHFFNILMGKTGAHLYFIFMLCQYYVFSYLFKNVITKKTGWYFLALFMIIQYIFPKTYFSWNGMGVRSFLLTWIFTIYLGHILYWYRKQLVDWILQRKLVSYSLLTVSIASAVYFTFSSNYYTANHLRFVLLSFVVLLSCITFLLPVLDLFKKVQFRKGLTFYIYLSHPLFVLLANNYLIKKLGLYWILDNKAMFIVYMLAIYAVTFLFSYTWTGYLQKRTEMKRQARQRNLSTTA